MVDDAGIIPAYAGSTRLFTEYERRGGDHPRIRGEHYYLDSGVGSTAGIIPAYAGSTQRRQHRL